MVLAMIKKRRWARTSAQFTGIALCFERKKIFFGTLHYAAGNRKNGILEISLDGLEIPKSKGSYRLLLLSIYSCLRKLLNG